MTGSTGGKLYSSADSWRAMPGGPFDIFVGVEGEEWPTRPVATAYEGHVAVHIASHDPARVLAEVAAKQRIIARYTYRRSMQPEGGIAPNRWDDLTRHYWEVCRDLAAPYADHPDFDPSWRVTMLMTPLIASVP